MKIEKARQILNDNEATLEKSGCPVPKTPSEARYILNKYDRGEINFCDEDTDQKLIRKIYHALTIILCSEMGREHKNDPKRAQRQAAKDRRRRPKRSPIR
jgi:hypothetical protein